MGKKMMKIWNFISEAKHLMIVWGFIVYTVTFYMSVDYFYNPYPNHALYALFFAYALFVLVNLIATDQL